MKFSITFHPQIDGQSKRTIQTLEDMLRAYALDFFGNWDKYLPLVELPIIIVSTLVLEWHYILHCTVENVELQFVGRK